MFASGQIGNVAGTRQLADTGITGQNRAALENITRFLSASGSSLDRVVKCTVFLVSFDDYAGMKAVCTSYGG